MGKMYGSITIDHHQEVREIKVGERAFLYGIPKLHEYGFVISDSKSNALEEAKKTLNKYIRDQYGIVIIDPYEEYLNSGWRHMEFKSFFNNLTDENQYEEEINSLREFNDDIHNEYVEALKPYFQKLENNELSDDDCKDFSTKLSGVLRSMNGYVSYFYDVLAHDGIPHNRPT